MLVGVIFWLEISKEVNRTEQKKHSSPNQKKDNPPKPQDKSPKPPKKPKDNPPPPNFPPDLIFDPHSDPDRTTFKASYFGELGQSYMYIIHDSNESILIDEKNLVFGGKLKKELTNKDYHYIFGFSLQKAEKYHNQSGVYYFSERNNDFSVMIKLPISANWGIKREDKFAYIGIGEGHGYSVFTNNLPLFEEVEDFKTLFINKNHPTIKKLESQGKLKLGLEPKKQFIIRFGTPNMISKEGKLLFEEFNEIEITEV